MSGLLLPYTMNTPEMRATLPLSSGTRKQAVLHRQHSQLVALGIYDLEGC